MPIDVHVGAKLMAKFLQFFIADKQKMDPIYICRVKGKVVPLHAV